MRGTASVLAGLLAVAVASASAQTPNIVVRNTMKNGARQVQITVEDPPQRVVESGPYAIPPVVLAPPDGGEIQGTMLVGGRRFAVTANRLVSIGESVRGLRVTEITLQHVRLSGSARTYELDLDSMQWTAGEELAAAK